jgi:beta-N-acetylhexosaminidase
LKYRKLLEGSSRLLPPDKEAEAVFAEQSLPVSLASRLAEASVTLVKDAGRLFPLCLPPGSRVMVFDLPEDQSDLAALAVVDGGAAANSLEKAAMHVELERMGHKVTWVRHLSEYERQIEECDLLVYLFRTRPQAGRNSVRICYNALQSLDFNRIYSPFPCVFVSLASPYILWDLPQLPNLICSYSGTEEAQQAVIRAMFGKIPFQGECPVNIPDYLHSKGSL